MYSFAPEMQMAFVTAVQFLLLIFSSWSGLEFFICVQLVQFPAGQRVLVLICTQKNTKIILKGKATNCRNRMTPKNLFKGESNL
jgi:hypothetical protein